MFDKIIELAKEFWHYLCPFFIVSHFEGAILLRFGHYKKTYGRGIWWKWPLIDEIHSCIITTDTLAITAVNITTTDNMTITVGAVLEYEIFDPYLFLVETNEAKTNAHDLCRSAIADYMADIEWAKCKNKRTVTEINKKVTIKCEQMGIRVKSFMLTDLCLSRVVKVFGTLM